jgi:hypothetical protein
MTFAVDIGRMVAKGPLRPLTEKESYTLIQLSFASSEPIEAQAASYKELLGQSMILRIMDSRFQQHLGTNINFSPCFLIWLSTPAQGNPGFSILLVAFLAYMRSEGKNLTFKECLNYYFADGIPTAENLMLAWNAQKVDGVNGLDMQESWQ